MLKSEIEQYSQEAIEKALLTLIAGFVRHILTKPYWLEMSLTLIETAETISKKISGISSSRLRRILISSAEWMHLSSGQRGPSDITRL